MPAQPTILEPYTTSFIAVITSIMTSTTYLIRCTPPVCLPGGNVTENLVTTTCGPGSPALKVGGKVLCLLVEGEQRGEWLADVLTEYMDIPEAREKDIKGVVGQEEKGEVDGKGGDRDGEGGGGDDLGVEGR